MVVLLLISFNVLAKDATKAPDSARISKGGPAIECNATNKTASDKQAPVPLPLPVRIVEEPLESDDAKSRADHARNNEDQDLQAQQRMASAAEYQLKATIVLIILSAIGTGLLIWTVRDTRKSADAARGSADAARRSADIGDQGLADARRTSEKQLRAYVNVSSVRISNIANVKQVKCESRNYGHTPATKIVIRYDFSVGKLNWESATTLEPTMHARSFEHGVMGPTAPMRLKVDLPPLLPGVGTHMEQMGNAFFFWGDIKYEDVFGQPQTTWFRCMIRGKDWLSGGKMGICHQGNDAT